LSYAAIYSRASVGIDAPLVSIEVHLANGIPSFTLVGLPETTVRESRERVRSALIQSGFEFPAKRIIVNLAPADLPKSGGRFDLAIAIGILAASGQVDVSPHNRSLDQYEFLGELSLAGEVRPITACLPAVVAATKVDRMVFIAKQNKHESLLCRSARILCIESLAAVVEQLITSKNHIFPSQDAEHFTDSVHQDVSDIIGQEQAKRALLIAAAGMHNLLFVGPPGTGKSMLAQRFTTLLPPLNEAQALESATINSVKGNTLNNQNWYRRPFRNPHHSASLNAMVGGGSIPKPGEISLANHGVLFLDELPEFGRKVIDALREPLETGDIQISRANAKVTFPAQFQLVAAMNPSPTGDVHDGRTAPDQVIRYLNRISGPLLDRIDLQVEVNRQSLSDDRQQASNQVSDRSTSKDLREKVLASRQLQLSRQGCLNSQLYAGNIEQFCRLSESNNTFFLNALDKIGGSHRAMHRILKVARTIADLEGSAEIERVHLAEAMGYRALETLIRQLSSC